MDDLTDDNTTTDQSVIGHSVVIKFPSLGDATITGKVDTGATTSSLHATNIQTDNNTVRFVCPEISNNVITLELVGSQEVVSADAGGQHRPMIKLDISVGDKQLSGVVFNLNDRSEMDSPILIGQNIIKTGNFVIDLNKDQQDLVDESVNLNEKEEKDTSERDTEILKAIAILKKHQVTIFELVEFLRTAPLYLRNVDDSSSN